MRYCARCILPDTRPNLTIDATGVCNACRSHASRPTIDWSQREHIFRDLAEEVKAKTAGHDCLVPVSGGKDSTWQVAKCLDYGLTPLAVTWRPPGRTELGQKNLDNLVSLGVDHIDYRINPRVERQFFRRAFEERGMSGLPMHMAIFNIPTMLAARLRIPLVVWGENSAFEYGGTEEEQRGFQLDDAWLKKFGVNHGTGPDDWIGDGLTRKNLASYYGPEPGELDAAGVRAVFLGYYFPWDPETTLAEAREKGFQVREEGPITGYYDYADIDDVLIAIHHHLKWYKFGFTRTWDNLSIEIRNGRMTREAALDALRRRGDETPHEAIRAFCDYVGITIDRYFEVAESFRDPNVWSKTGGTWRVGGFLLDDWEWT